MNRVGIVLTNSDGEVLDQAWVVGVDPNGNPNVLAQRVMDHIEFLPERIGTVQGDNDPLADEGK